MTPKPRGSENVLVTKIVIKEGRGVSNLDIDDGVSADCGLQHRSACLGALLQSRCKRVHDCLVHLHSGHQCLEDSTWTATGLACAIVL